MNEAVSGIRKAGQVSFDLETTSLDPLEATIVGFALCWEDEGAAYIPVNHTQDGKRLEPQLTLEQVMTALDPIFNDPTVGKLGQNLKYDIGVLAANGYGVGGISSDTMLMDYLLEPERNRHSLDDLALRYLGHRMVPFSEVIATSTSELFSEVPLDKAVHYACEDAHAVWKLSPTRPRIEERSLSDLYTNLELPVAQFWGVWNGKGSG